MKYKLPIVLAYFAECGLPTPSTEFKFHPTRKWRFDFAWNEFYSGSGYTVRPMLALEVQGGIFIAGRHSRGAALVKEWEKLNAAAEMGYRIIYFQPSELCTQATIDLIKRCLQ